MANGIQFDWDDENRNHLAAHRVSSAEFVQLLNNDPLDLDYELIEGEERYRSVWPYEWRPSVAGGMDGSQWQGTRRNSLCGWCFGQEGFSGESPMKKQPKRVIPAFATAADEAEWWYKNRNVHGKEFLAAVKSGEAQVLTKEKLQQRIVASKKTPAPVVALRIPETDLALARKQAEKKGLPYQTYLKSLLHEALVEREKRKVAW